jgi:hypothetical protein
MKYLPGTLSAKKKKKETESKGHLYSGQLRSTREREILMAE